MFGKNTLQALLVVAASTQAVTALAAESVTRLYTAEANAESWRIDEPRVTARSTVYSQIVLRPNDKVLFLAGGCVQTGGHGNTWKRYVNPDSASLYRGQVQIPGLFYSFTNLSDLVPVNSTWSREYLVPQMGGALTLGYTDDDYSDNGYWSHDDGTQDQCLGVGNAYLNVFIRRAH